MVAEVAVVTAIVTHHHHHHLPSWAAAHTLSRATKIGVIPSGENVTYAATSPADDQKAKGSAEGRERKALYAERVKRDRVKHDGSKRRGEKTAVT